MKNYIIFLVKILIKGAKNAESKIFNAYAVVGVDRS